MKNVVEYKDVEILRKELVVLKHVDLCLEEGEFAYLIGRVGSGKSSLLKSMYAEIPVYTGKARVMDYDLTDIRRKDVPMLRRRIGIVFQDFQLLMDRSVEDNLVFVLKATGWKDSTAISKRISEVLDAVGMSYKAHKMPHQLSGGEQQRIAIARSLLNSPEVIIADEPTGNLDPETADGIMQLLKRINTEEGTAIVMVTHNMNLCDRYQGRMMVCKDEKCQEKECEEIIDLSITDL